VVIAAGCVGLSALAITDHDTLSAIAVARPEASRLGLELIAGIELTAVDDRGREIHILGHFVRDDDPALRATTASMRDGRAERLRAMAERLVSLGCGSTWRPCPRLPRATIGRRHLADWLSRTQQVAHPREAFARYLGDGGPADVAKLRVPWAEAIALIRGAGGVAGLAHPAYDLRESALRTLVDGGLAAVEVDGPGVDARRGARLRAWARALDLVPIAGSDFHAPDRPGRWVGSTVTPASTSSAYGRVPGRARGRRL